MYRTCIITGDVVDLALTLVECVFHLDWLPLGGSHGAQLGVCLGVSLIAVTLIDLFSNLQA